MDEAKKKVMEMWRGIPAFYIAAQATLLSRRMGVDWSGSSKGAIADAFVGLDKFHSLTDQDPQALADRARAAMESTREATARTKRAMEQHEERQRLLRQSAAEARALLMTIAKDIQGRLPEPFLSEWLKLKGETRRRHDVDLECIYAKMYTDQYLGLRKILKGMETKDGQKV